MFLSGSLVYRVWVSYSLCKSVSFSFMILLADWSSELKYHLLLLMKYQEL